MTNTIVQWIGIVVAIAIAALSFASHTPAAPVESDVGGTTQGFENAVLGYKVNGTFVIQPVSGTTTAALGCVGITPTSTATRAKIVLSPLGATSTFSGTAYWSYGTCP
jgi:hypothetical protein